MRARILLLSLTVLCLVLLSQSPAQAQAETAMPPFIEERATHIAEVTIVNVTPVELDGEAYTVAEAEVMGTDKGSLPQTILIQVEGGLLSDGRRVFVSHQPYLSVGDHLDVALTSSPSQWAASALPDTGDVYSIVGGLDGASAVAGELQSQADASGDFGLTGAAFSDFPVDFYVNAANSGVSATATRNAVKAALDIWEADAGSDIDFTYKGATSLKGNLLDDKNVIYWTTTPNPAHSYLAQASWSMTPNGDVISFDVKFNRDYGWSQGAVGGRWDITTVMLHESGHALGLAHVNVGSEIMYASISSGRTKGLGAGDRSGAAHLYPAVTQDPARVAAAADIVASLESYANANFSYVISGGGHNGGGQGWFKAFPSTYPASIRNVLSYQGHLPNGAPTDPNGRDFLIYRCKDRIGVFSDTDSATSTASASNWWSSNDCTRYPINNGYTHLTLAAPIPTQDVARVAAAADIVTSLESYANANFSYVISGGGHNGGGQGRFKAFPSTYPASIRNVLSYQGHLPNGAPTDPNGRDFLIYRCKDRIGVFSDTDSATSTASASNWWSSNGCTRYPINNGYTHLTLSVPLPTQDPARVAAAADIADGLESYGVANATYVVSGGGHNGAGQGLFDNVKSSYPDSIADVMVSEGYFSGSAPVDPNAREFLIYRCQDRIGVFSDTDDTNSAASATNWWSSNGCTQYPINSGYTHLTLTVPLP